MNRYLLKDHWATLVTEFKDEEREMHGRSGYSTEQLAMDVLDHLRITRFRQWALVSQKRGEEFERMMARMEARGHDPEALKRFLDSEELWALTLEMSTQ